MPARLFGRFLRVGDGLSLCKHPTSKMRPARFEAHAGAGTGCLPCQQADLNVRSGGSDQRSGVYEEVRQTLLVRAFIDRYLAGEGINPLVGELSCQPDTWLATIGKRCKRVDR